MKYIRYAIIYILIFYSGVLKAGEEAAELWKQFTLDSKHASVVELAIKTRGFLSNDFSLELSSILTDFTQENSIHKASLAAFEYLMGNAISPTIIDLQGFEDLGDGYFKDIVLLFKDSDGNPLLVMKWFQRPSTFLSEISAMEKLHSLNLTQSRLVAPLTVGKAFYDDKPYYLLVETVASGDTIVSLIKAIANLPEGNERRKAVNAAMEAVVAQAKTLAELHIKDSIEKDLEVPPLDIEEVASKLNELNSGLLSIDDLVPQIKTIENAYYAASHLARYRLGDPNWGNFLYDNSTSEITMIDVNFMNFSLGVDGLPINDAASDYSIVMSHFWFLEVVLSAEECQLILNSFDEAYRDATLNNGPTDLELAFAEIARWIIYARGGLLNPSEENEDVEKYLDQHIQHLRRIIQCSSSASPALNIS